MQPLFESSDPCSLPSHLQWYIPDPKEHTGKPLLLCGKPVGLYTHRVGRRTWPCLTQFKKLGRECPHCERSRRFTTWVPCLTISLPRKKIVLMGGEHTWKSVKAIEKNTLVTAHYAKMLKPTLVFAKDQTQLGKLQMEAAAREEIPEKGDITRWLLHYWQWAALTLWFGEAYRESLKTRHLRERAENHGVELLDTFQEMQIA